MALTISTGFVVDDAIVRHGERLAPHRGGQAAHAGRARRREADRLHDRLDHDFAPRRVHPDSPHGRHRRRLFREFAMTLSIAIAVSAVVSLTLTPMMCAKLLRHDQGKHAASTTRRRTRSRRSSAATVECSRGCSAGARSSASSRSSRSQRPSPSTSSSRRASSRSRTWA